MSTQSEKPSVSAVAPFATAFQRSATWEAWAPGRVNLIGEHIDYCDGFVMPFAIDRYIVIAGCANGSSEARIGTALGEEIATLDLSVPQEIGEPKWANYIRGVIRGFQDRGHHIPGFDAYILSSVPGGAGLSSSAGPAVPMGCPAVTRSPTLTLISPRWA